jgi:hypothetical protein
VHGLVYAAMGVAMRADSFSIDHDATTNHDGHEDFSPKIASCFVVFVVPS